MQPDRLITRRLVAIIMSLHPAQDFPSQANARNVWTIPTQGRPDAHFATFPDELPRRCILAGTSERGVCADCGAPWVSVWWSEKS